MSKKSSQPDSTSAENAGKQNSVTNEKSAAVSKEVSKETAKERSKESKPAKNKAVKKPKNRQAFITLITICFALSAAGLAGYDFWLLQRQVATNAQLAKTQIGSQGRIEQLEFQLASTKSDLVKEVQARESMQAEHQALSLAMQNISAKLGRSTVAWRMAEVEYLLTVANHRLTLAQDRKTSIAVFETADERIKAIGDLSLLKVRKKIADELLALRAMPEVDISGLALRVGSLVDSVEKFPLLDKKRIAVAMKDNTENTPANWRQLPMAIWNDLKSLVQIRRHQQPTEPLLAPDQTRFLYQNLTLKLEQARLAVLRHDTALFRQYLTEADSWLTNYFETEAPVVASAIASIKAMLTIDLQPPVPDVGGSLRLLREVMKEHRLEVVVGNNQAATK